MQSWAQLETFVECQYFWLNEEDDSESPQTSIAELEIFEQNYNFSLTCDPDRIGSIDIGAKLWLIYKPDFSISTWFSEKPDEIFQSGLIQIEITEKSDDYHRMPCSIQISVQAKIIDILPFESVADRFTPTYTGEPYSFLENSMDSYHTNNMNMITRLPQHQINPHINLISGYDRIVSGNIIFINFIYLPSDFGGWIIVQQRQEYEYPVLVAYTEMTTNSLTFIGHRPLTADEWLFFEKWERQILGIDREIKDYLVKTNAIERIVENNITISKQEYRQAQGNITRINKANYDYW
ncbi:MULTISPECIES: hypothetical protein [unclassified Chamaesiphon]|uniref:hypothetical protein n=1 Tax=unclassified Chamaesiphon TaxID=2620921 RepID=UPI00286C8FA0|nr:MULTISPECIES: hypothetical protein [unclassified Chamaesiphon]